MSFCLLPGVGAAGVAADGVMLLVALKALALCCCYWSKPILHAQSVEPCRRNGGSMTYYTLLDMQKEQVGRSRNVKEYVTIMNSPFTARRERLRLNFKN
eukprot:scaffold10345_cov158-Cylindrotheca_fusiformis.AAC.5